MIYTGDILLLQTRTIVKNIIIITVGGELLGLKMFLALRNNVKQTTDLNTDTDFYN